MPKNTNQIFNRKFQKIGSKLDSENGPHHVHVDWQTMFLYDILGCSCLLASLLACELGTKSKMNEKYLLYSVLLRITNTRQYKSTAGWGFVLLFFRAEQKSKKPQPPKAIDYEKKIHQRKNHQKAIPLNLFTLEIIQKKH